MNLRRIGKMTFDRRKPDRLSVNPADIQWQVFSGPAVCVFRSGYSEPLG